MNAMSCTWVVTLAFLFGVSEAYIRPSGYCTAPRYESCRDSIEDLKALVEITQCLKPDPNCVCPACTSLSEEIIIKLVNALIYTATQNYEFGKCSSGVPIIIGGGGGHTGGISGGHTGTSGGTSGGGTSSGGTPGSGSGNGLINVGLLNKDDTLSVGIGGKKVIGVDVGPQSEHGKDGLVQVGVLDKDNSLLNVGLGGKEILGVNVGNQNRSARTTTSGNRVERATAMSTDTSGNGGTTGSLPSINSGSSTHTMPTPATALGGNDLTRYVLANTATGVAQNESMLPSNRGMVGTRDTTNVNQGTTSPSNSTKINSPEIVKPAKAISQ